MYKQLYSIQKIQIGSKSFNKWKDFTTEIKPEYFDKLIQFITIENIGDGKKSKAFRLKKNLQDKNIFKKLNQEYVPHDFANIQFNQNLNNINLPSQNNNGNNIRINLIPGNNIINEENNENNVDFD